MLHGGYDRKANREFKLREDPNQQANKVENPERNKKEKAVGRIETVDQAMVQFSGLLGSGSPPSAKPGGRSPISSAGGEPYDCIYRDSQAISSLICLQAGMQHTSDMRSTICLLN